MYEASSYIENNLCEHSLTFCDKGYISRSYQLFSVPTSQKCNKSRLNLNSCVNCVYCVNGPLVLR